MAEDRKNSGAEAPAEATATEKAGGGGFKAWLPLILAVVLMPALAFGMTKFVIVPELQKNLGLKPAEAAHGSKGKSADAKKVSIPFNKVLVNIAGTMGSRYLLVSLTVVGAGGEEFKAKVTESDAQLRDLAMGILRTKTLADLEKPGAVNIIRSELITGFNGVLGDNAVAEIFITEFGIQ